MAQISPPSVTFKRLPGEPQFGDAESSSLREFLSSTLGQLFLRRLDYERPTVTGYDPEVRRVQSDERAGYEKCITTMLTLAETAKLTEADRSVQSR